MQFKNKIYISWYDWYSKNIFIFPEEKKQKISHSFLVFLIAPIIAALNVVTLKFNNIETSSFFYWFPLSLLIGVVFLGVFWLYSFFPTKISFKEKTIVVTEGTLSKKIIYEDIFEIYLDILVAFRFVLA